MKSYNRVLFIGNSFTYYHNLPALFESYANLIDEDLKSFSITRGGWTLEQFANQNDEEGSKLYKILESRNDFDLIIIQEYSTRSYENYNSFYEATNKLINLIKLTQKKCDIYLYETWAFPLETQSKNWTFSEMEKKIYESYHQVAKRLDIKVINVGKAFLNEEKNKELQLFEDDLKHPSLIGSKLIALTILATVYEIDPHKIMENYEDEMIIKLCYSSYLASKE